jgi:hypothetical protein
LSIIRAVFEAEIRAVLGPVMRLNLNKFESVKKGSIRDNVDYSKHHISL